MITHEFLHHCGIWADATDITLDQILAGEKDDPNRSNRKENYTLEAAVKGGRENLLHYKRNPESYV